MGDISLDFRAAFFRQRLRNYCLFLLQLYLTLPFNVDALRNAIKASPYLSNP